MKEHIIIKIVLIYYLLEILLMENLMGSELNMILMVILLDKVFIKIIYVLQIVNKYDLKLKLIFIINNIFKICLKKYLMN